MKNVYFLSDAHLGSLAIPHQRMQERRLVRFLDSIKEKAGAVYLLGDMFDFWYEYKYVVPKGFTRFLGKLSELTDMGVEVHYFTGNHDIWAYEYLEKECGVILHKKPETTEIYGKEFFIRAIFHNKVCQWLFSALHPRWGISFGLTWAKHSYIKHKETDDVHYMGDDKEHLVLFAKDYIEDHPDIDYFIFGHRHIELDIKLARHTRLMILGDWISQFTYAVFDGEHMFLEEYVEGESQP